MALLSAPVAALLATSLLAPALLLARPVAPPSAVREVGAAAATPVPAWSAPVVAGATRAAPAGWSWPLSPAPRVVHPFTVGPFPWSPGHRGVDLAAGPGRAVLTPADGVIAFAGDVAGRPVLVVAHAGGLRSTFEPVRGSLPAGRAVRRGEAVGLLVAAAVSHCAPAVCLHWGVLHGGTYLDPLTLLPGRRGPPVLLPLR